MIFFLKVEEVRRGNGVRSCTLHGRSPDSNFVGVKGFRLLDGMVVEVLAILVFKCLVPQ